MKGLVVEKQARCTIVLTPTGEYKKVQGTVKGEIGQEVTVSPDFSVPKAVAVAAVLVIAVLLSQALPVMLRQNEAYAYVTLDINPSAEFAINADDIVLSAHPYNQGAENILADMEYRGKGIGLVLADFTQAAISREKSESSRGIHVVVSYYSEHTEDELAAEAELMRMVEAQRQVLKSSGQETDINTVIVDTETRREARRLGVSAGRLEEAERGKKTDRDSLDEWVPAGEAKANQDSSNEMNENHPSKESQTKAIDNEANKKEKPDTEKENQNTQGKQETNNGALKGNFKQAGKEQAEKALRGNNGRKAGQNEDKSNSGFFKGEKGRSKDVRQRGGELKSRNKAGTNTNKTKKEMENKGMQESGQGKKSAPVFKA